MSSTLVPHRTLAVDLPHALGPDPDASPLVRLQGWVHRRRQLANVTFVILRDRTGLAQVVAKDPAVLAQMGSLSEETVVEVVGRAVANASAPHGVEVIDPHITALSGVAATPTVELWRPELGGTLPTQLDHAALTWRHPRKQAVWQIAAAAMRGFRETLTDLDFVEIATPKLVGSSTESGANVFEVDYFGRPAYLAQSPQFYKQTMVGVFERVFEVGPVFRAEPHDTVRHLAEYVSLDVELGFIRDHRDVLVILREVLAGMLSAVETHAAAAIDLLDVGLPAIPEQLPLIHFRDALALVGADPDEPDLAPEHERRLGAWAMEHYGSDVLAVEGYPLAKRAFYTHPQPDNPRWSNSFDLLFRGLELVTGGQRLHQYADYLQALADRGESPEPYESYLATFAHGMPPHGGFAIGLERFVARLLEVDNIRETTLFPRDLHRLAP